MNLLEVRVEMTPPTPSGTERITAWRGDIAEKLRKWNGRKESGRFG
jgi:hypothetical protein